ncbi:hypothetical protein HYC85_020556 [Camellia sinensis]|uniref:EGF-like domain-containing protein n=1 Tax=Camellia sinensis TaxID=4442 RepID=A0A7J7GTX4_CAMSI|nr:hypothetical protein HYC85_020556 [Camellia sinensis]
MELKILCGRCVVSPESRLFRTNLRFAVVVFEIVSILVWLEAVYSKPQEHQLRQGKENGGENIISHSCIHDEILERRRRPGRKVYYVSPQVYGGFGMSKPIHRKGRALLGLSEIPEQQNGDKQPIRIYLNYDAVGLSPDRDCQNVGEIVKASIMHSRGKMGYVDGRIQAPSTTDSASDTELEDALRQLLDRRSSTALSTASSSFARSGNLASSPCAFLCHPSLPWIIDSGASDHMSGSSDLFSVYKPSSGQDKVRIADGTVSSISGTGLVHDLITGRTIGSGSAENGLYFLDQPDKLAYSTTTSSTTSADSYFLSSPVSPSSFPGEPWCEVSPVPPMVEPVALAPPSTTVLPMVEPVALAPPSTGTIEPTVTKNKDDNVYVRDIDRKQVNWIHETVSATPLPSPASDESLGNFESRETIDLDVPIAKRKGNDSGEIPLLKKYLAKEFEIKDLGSLKYFLGIEVARSKDGIFISQRKYVLDLLKETGMLGCKACATPLEPNQKLGDDEGGEVVDRGSYQRLVGKLIYLSHSRPDIAVAVSIALGQTADWFRRALAVDPVKGNLRLSGYSACGQDGGVQLPREYVEDGVADADLVLLVTARPTTGNTLAWAVACERDQWGRAIAGHVNVAPRHLTAEAETLLSATLVHEVMHVLGFDPHAFAHFRDERKRRRNQVTEQVIDEKLGRMVTRVVLPRVVMHSRCHYGAFSENFTGLELEDGGGRGSHWEKRLLMNEIMTGSVDTRSVVSKMTLALLEDSGWYQANYSMAGHLDWGRNQGAEFVTFPCNLWKGAYHCNMTQLSGCTYNREAEGYCPIVNYSGDLPQWARYFPQANKGGQSSLADYCTYYVAYSDGSCTDTNSARAPDRMLGEVAVDGIWKVCPEAGGAVHFPGFSGYCPSNCNGHGQCLQNGVCECENGYTGIDCSTAVCDEQCSLHGGVCDNGVCEFRCSDYAGYTCQNSSMMVSSLSVCKNVLENDGPGQHCAPSESSILQQLEVVVVMPNYNRLFPIGTSWRRFPFFKSSYCDAAAKQLACWISIQKCDEDGDNRLRVCHSACQLYNLACGASLDCSDQTLFSNEDEGGGGQCTGSNELPLPWYNRLWIRKMARALEVGFSFSHPKVHIIYNKNNLDHQ